MNNRYDYHLWTFCNYDFEEIAVAKLSQKLSIDYGVLNNWWKGKRHGRGNLPTLPDKAYQKILDWAILRGYDAERQLNVTRNMEDYSQVCYGDQTGKF